MAGKQSAAYRSVSSVHFLTCSTPCIAESRLASAAHCRSQAYAQHAVQGHLKPDRKLSSLWQPILELAADGTLETLLQAKQAGDSVPPGLSTAETWCASDNCIVTISVHFPLVHNTTAARLEGSGLVHGHSPAQAAVADWRRHLQGRFGTDVALREDGTDALAVSVAAGILQVCPASSKCTELAFTIHVEA